MGPLAVNLIPTLVICCVSRKGILILARKWHRSLIPDLGGIGIRRVRLSLAWATWVSLNYMRLNLRPNQTKPRTGP